MLSPTGLTLSDAKRRRRHIDEGFDFLGFRIQRSRKRGTTKRVLYTRPVQEGARPYHWTSPHADPQVVHTRPSRRCWASSTRSSGAGALTFVTACRKRPSATSTRAPGIRASDGFANDTTRRNGCLLPPLLRELAARRGRRTSRREQQSLTERLVNIALTHWRAIRRCENLYWCGSSLTQARRCVMEQILRFFAEHEIKSSTWELVRHRVVTDHAFKVGAQPGVVLFLEAESQDAAAEIVNGLPVVQQGDGLSRSTRSVPSHTSESARSPF